MEFSGKTIEVYATKNWTWSAEWCMNLSQILTKSDWLQNWFTDYKRHLPSMAHLCKFERIEFYVCLPVDYNNRVKK